MFGGDKFEGKEIKVVTGATGRRERFEFYYGGDVRRRTGSRPCRMQRRRDDQLLAQAEPRGRTGRHRRQLEFREARKPHVLMWEDLDKSLNCPLLIFDHI